MKQIRTVHELPEWFQLENYSAIRNMDEQDLAEELSIRAKVVNLKNPAKKSAHMSIYRNIAFSLKPLDFNHIRTQRKMQKLSWRQ